MKLSRLIIGLTAIVGVVVLLLVVPPSVRAETTYGGGSVQGYGADAPIENGTIVQLTGKDSNRVKIATQAELQNMFGVTVDRNQLPLMISGQSIENETFVAVSGTYNVIVSTQGGSIAIGDYVTLSLVDGVAMKAGTTEKTVFGRAAGVFDGKGTTLGTTTLKDTEGKDSQTVTLGSIPVTIDIKRNPNEKSTKVNVPEVLQRLGQAIAEKEVSPIRLYLSMAITGVSIITALVLLYAGVRNAIISIGRNPMSKRSIFRALTEVILTSALVLIIGLFAVYLLLKL
ncbi:MAG: hypothetical protein ACSLEY_00355 [Candidatus Saccharimonadales bacterium]